MAQIHSGVDTKVDRPTPKIPPDQWLNQLLKSLTTPQQRTIALFMSFTGCRVGEACKVLVKHYDPERGRVFIEKTKTGDAREAVLTELVNRAMQLLDRSDPNARLFGYTSRHTVRQAFKRACDRAGLDYYSPHKLGRHAFAKRILAEDQSLKLLMEAGGWKSLTAVNVYAHLERSQIESAVRSVSTQLDTKLAQKLFDKKSEEQKTI